MNASKNLTEQHADPSNTDDNINTTCENEPSRLIDYLINNRKTSLFISIFLGLVLFVCMYYYLPECHDAFEIFWCEKFGDLTRNSLSLLILGLPTFFILWIFRTHDVQRQIDNNIFFKCARMLVNDEKRASKKTALEQLVYLRQKNPSYKEKIDSLTQGLSLEKANLNFAQLNDINLSLANLTGADLESADLHGADLTRTNLTYVVLAGADLSGVNLTNTILDNIMLVCADLTGADLTGAYLINADLTDTDLYNTNLTGAELYGTNLEKVKNYDTANFKGAKYDENTKFPPGFDPEKAGCIVGRAEDITP